MAYTKEERRAYNLARYHRIRNAAIASLGGKCSKCDSVDRLQLDHIDPSKKEMEISRFLDRPLSDFHEELKKCQVLCRKCHKEKSILESGKKVAEGTHGTLSSYRYCHCVLCKKAKSDYAKKRKERLKNSIVPQW